MDKPYFPCLSMIFNKKTMTDMEHSVTLFHKKLPSHCLKCPSHKLYITCSTKTVTAPRQLYIRIRRDRNHQSITRTAT